MKSSFPNFFACLLASSLLAAGLAGHFSLVGNVASASRVAKENARSSAAQSKAEPLNLFGNGFFQALHGYFFLDEGNRLHVYRAVPKILDPQSGKLELQPEDDELKPKWKGEPYYHEIYHLNEGEWVPKMWSAFDSDAAREFSNAPANYVKFERCDRNDELDLRREDLKKALWPTIKIKDVLEFGNYAAVIYSVNPAGLTGPSLGYAPDQRPIWLALLAKGRQGWASAPKTQSLSVGNYCGKAALDTMRDGRKRPVLLLFFEEGDYNVVHSFVAD